MQIYTQKYKFLGAKQWKKQQHITGQGSIRSGISYMKKSQDIRFMTQIKRIALRIIKTRVCPSRPKRKI